MISTNFNPKWHHTLGRITPVLSLHGLFRRSIIHITHVHLIGASSSQRPFSPEHHSYHSCAPHWRLIFSTALLAGASFTSLMCTSLAPHLLNGPSRRSFIHSPKESPGYLPFFFALFATDHAILFPTFSSSGVTFLLPPILSSGAVAFLSLSLST